MFINLCLPPPPCINFLPVFKGFMWQFSYQNAYRSPLTQLPSVRTPKTYLVMASTFMTSQRGTGSPWSLKQNKQFEDALATFDKETPDRWHNIARRVDGKSAEEVRRYYDDLLRDIMKIENDQVPIPNYRTISSNSRGYGSEKRLLKNLRLQ